jgi:outer membrane immunogenic protein
MKKIVTLCVTAIALSAFAAPASAAVATGGRIEAVTGYDNVSFDLTSIGLTGDLDSNGILYGVGAGYDFAAGEKVAFGIDLEGTESTADVEETVGTTTDRISAGRDLYAGLRLTTAISNTANLFFKAGYTNFRLKAESVTGGTTTLSDSTNLDGVRGGVGVQVGLGGNTYVGGEYRYSNYESDVIRHQGVLTFGVRM